MTAGIAVSSQKQVRLRMPKTRLQIARPEVFGCSGIVGTG
jgi:hypothetical protein